MAGQNKKKRGRKHATRDGRFFIVLSGVLFGVFLWGRVHIDFLLQETGALESQKGDLIHEIDDLRVSVNKLERYQRIVGLAEQQGLAFVDASDYKPLIVNFEGIEYYHIHRRSDLRIARIQDAMIWLQSAKKKILQDGRQP